MADISVLTKPLAQETAVELLANGQKVAVLMCTPHNLDDLAVGHLFSRGMINNPDRVLTIGACADMRVMSVIAPGALAEDSFGLGQVIASGCCSGETQSDISGLKKLEIGSRQTSLKALKNWCRTMFLSAELYPATGGLHCAALAVPKATNKMEQLFEYNAYEKLPQDCNYMVVREDVGRHNAVDKVLGKAFMDRIDFSSACLLTSGRIATDMVLKAAVAGIPVLVSRSIPTTSASALATKVGISLVGRITDRQSIVYTYPERIRME
ncbi:formate dehydrogenase accessory sulfurtransferase FdhD [Spirochaetota bacterium]